MVKDNVTICDHGFPFSGLTKFPDFSSFFPIFKCFLTFWFFSLKTWSILANNIQFIHISLKITKNICLKFPELSSILCDFPWLSLTFPLSSKFPGFHLTGKCLPIFPGYQSEWEPRYYYCCIVHHFQNRTCVHDSHAQLKYFGNGIIFSLISISQSRHNFACCSQSIKPPNVIETEKITDQMSESVVQWNWFIINAWTYATEITMQILMLQNKTC